MQHEDTVDGDIEQVYFKYLFKIFNKHTLACNNMGTAAAKSIIATQSSS